jgi:uncharacterized protein YcbK (DUF882 family)
MGDLTKNFARWEFECPCNCGFDDVDPRLVADLQALRDAVGVPVLILAGGGCRCREQNRRQGGAPSSQHQLGTAADIEIPGLTVDQIVAEVSRHCPSVRGIGVYRHRRPPKEPFVHVDVRRNVARWDDEPAKVSP